MGRVILLRALNGDETGLMSPNYFEVSDTYSSGAGYELNELNELILEKFKRRQ